jgi:hypothetical protein
MFVNDLKREFESDGVHLSASGKAAVLEMKGFVLRVESQFMQTISNPQNQPEEEVLLGEEVLFILLLLHINLLQAPSSPQKPLYGIFSRPGCQTLRPHGPSSVCPFLTEKVSRDCWDACLVPNCVGSCG